MAIGVTASTPAKGKYYDTVILKVENTLHRVPKYHLETWSQTFKDMFKLPQASESEGSSEENPIILSHCTNAEFESLLEVLLKPSAISPLVMSKSQWVAVLKLSTMWDMPDVRKLSIREISTLNASPTEKVDLAMRFKVSSWFIEGCTSLIEDPQDVGTINLIASSLGWEIAARISWARASRARAEVIKGKVIIASDKWKCGSCSGGVRVEQVHAAPRHTSPGGFGGFAQPQAAAPGTRVHCTNSKCSSAGAPNQIEVFMSDYLGAAAIPNTLSLVQQTFAETLREMY